MKAKTLSSSYCAQPEKKSYSVCPFGASRFHTHNSLTQPADLNNLFFVCCIAHFFLRVQKVHLLSRVYIHRDDNDDDIVVIMNGADSWGNNRNVMRVEDIRNAHRSIASKFLLSQSTKPSSFSLMLLLLSSTKKNLINYAFCIVEWMRGERENNWIESCPWIEWVRERYIRRRKTSFLCLRQCNFYSLHSCMRFMHENCISSLFRCCCTNLPIFLLFALCSMVLNIAKSEWERNTHTRKFFAI